MMTAREKLIEILSTKIHPREGIDPAAVVADFPSGRVEPRYVMQSRPACKGYEPLEEGACNG